MSVRGKEKKVKVTFATGGEACVERLLASFLHGIHGM